jgi:hypothetical protein
MVRKFVITVNDFGAPIVADHRQCAHRRPHRQRMWCALFIALFLTGAFKGDDCYSNYITGNFPYLEFLHWRGNALFSWVRGVPAPRRRGRDEGGARERATLDGG